MERLILNSHAHIGDRITMQMDDESRGWVGKGEEPNGTEGVIIGFYRYISYTSRNEVRKDKPAGKYEGNGAPIVKWDNGKTQIISPHYIAIPKEIYNERRGSSNYKEAFDTPLYLGPLPSLPFYEDDVLALKEKIFGDSQLVRVRRIDYNHSNTFCDDGITPYPIYTVSPVDHSGPTTNIREEDVLQRVNCGLYWMWENDKDNIKFDSIKQEANFYRSIGYAEEMRNPRSGFYDWTIEEAEEALRNKTIAGVSVHGGFFGSGPSLVCYTYPELPELEERLRAAYQFDK